MVANQEVPGKAPARRQQPKANSRSGSTIVVWKLVKLRRPPKGHSEQPPAGRRHRWYHRPRLAWGTTVTLKVSLSPGSYPRMVVRARGGVAYFDGGVALVDVYAQVLNQQRPARPEDI